MKTKTLIIFSAMFIIFAFSGLLIAQAVNPATLKQGVVPDATAIGIDAGTTPTTAEGIAGIVVNIIKAVYTIFFIIAVLFVIFAAYGYLAGADNPEAVSKAHKQLMYAAIAVIIALLAISFNTIVQNFIGGSGGGGGGGSGVEYGEYCPLGVDLSTGGCIEEEIQGTPDFPNATQG